MSKKHKTLYFEIKTESWYNQTLHQAGKIIMKLKGEGFLLTTWTNMRQIIFLCAKVRHF
jgi:hypothetical protein